MSAQPHPIDDRHGDAPTGERVVTPWLVADEDGEALAALTDKQRTATLGRHTVVQAWLGYRERKAAEGISGRRALPQFVRNLANKVDNPPSAPTIRRWTAAFKHYGLRGLVDDRGRPSDNETHCSQEAWNHFKALYLTEQRRAVRDCYRMASVFAEDNGLAWPTYRTILRRVERELPSSIADYHRRGRRHWETNVAPCVQFDPTIYRPNQNWVGDHHQFDFLAMHDGAPIRPWLTAWMDARSRYFVAWLIAPTPHSGTIIASFGQGVREHGAPNRITIDNGKDYRSKGFAGGKKTKARVDEERVGGIVAQLGVEAHFTQPYKPGSKSIERAFREVCDKFSRFMPTYCGNKPENRPESLYADLRSENIHVPALAEATVLFRQWVEDVYHTAPHGGEGMNGLAPVQVFNGAIADAPPIARRTAPDELLEELLMPVATVKVTRKGVRYNGIHYGAHNTELFAMRDRQVMLRIDPLDASYVLVCDLAGRRLLRATNDRIRGTTHEDLRAAHKSKRNAARLAKQALPAARDAHIPLTEHAMIAAQTRINASADELRKAAGAEITRPVQLVPGAVGMTPARTRPPTEEDPFELMRAISRPDADDDDDDDGSDDDLTLTLRALSGSDDDEDDDDE